MATTALARAQTPTFILREGDAVGPPGHLITFLDIPDVNSVGGLCIGISTSDGSTTLEHFWANPTSSAGAIVRTEQLGLSGYDQTAFEGFYGYDDLGRICYGPTTTDLMTMTTGLDSLWVDDTPILSEGDNPLTEPTLVCRFNSRPSIIDGTGEPVWVGGLDDAGGTDVGRRLYRGAGHTIVQQTGPAPAPLVANIPNGGVGFDFRFSMNGTHWINEIDTDLPTAGDAYMVVDGAIATTCTGTLIGEGVVIPAESGGLGGEAWGSFDSLGINENGDFMITGDTGGAIATDEFISLNGNIVLREGDVLMDLGGGMRTVAGSIDYAAMNEDGDFMAAWDVDVAGIEALIVNNLVVLVEGDEVDWDGDGVVDAGHVLEAFGGIAAGAISNRSGGMIRVYATADVTVPGIGSQEGLLCIEMAPPPAYSTSCDAYPSLCNGDGGDQLGCTDCPCGNNATAGTVGGCLNSAGTSSRLAATGSASVSLPSGDTTDLRFTMSGGPAVATSVLLSGDAVAPTNLANPCFGLDSGSQATDRDGLRCAVQTVLRHGNRQTDAAGEIMDPTGPSRVWGGEAQPNDGIAVQGGFASGQTRYFQVTHRDDPTMVCMRGLNTSQAIEVTFTP